MSCDHPTETVVQRHNVRREGSQEIIAEAKTRMCLTCFLTRGTVHTAWDTVGVSFEAPLNLNYEVAARAALAAHEDARRST